MLRLPVLLITLVALPAAAHGPRKFSPFAAPKATGNIQTANSPNWSGYAVTGKNFTQAKGSWIVPTVNCAGNANSSASFWVGLDGWTTATVEQTGTDSDCNGKAPAYYAWYEFFPKAGVTITSIAVHPGDVMSAEITYTAPTFTASITDETTGASFTKSALVPGAKRASAEWIAEMNGSKFSNFGTVGFGQDSTKIPATNSATNETTSGGIAVFGNNAWKSILVNNNGAPLATPSALSTDGTSFTITRSP